MNGGFSTREKLIENIETLSVADLVSSAEQLGQEMKRLELIYGPEKREEWDDKHWHFRFLLIRAENIDKELEDSRNSFKD